MTSRFKVSFVALTYLSAGVLLMACKSTRSAPEASASQKLVWPPAPDEARIRYVKSISGPADMGSSPSALKRALRLITGGPEDTKVLVKPFGVAVDEAGNLCITDTGENTVCLCDFTRKLWRSWNAIGKTRLASPVAIARQGSHFYVADSELGKVFCFRDDGHDVFTISTPLQRPAGLALSGDSLIVADALAHAILVYNLRGELRFQFGKHGEGPGEFNFPTHVAVDQTGHLLVTDSLNSRVQVFDSSGKFVSQIGSAGDAPGHFARPKGIAVDTLGHIYVVDAVYDNIQIFDFSGQLLLTWGEGGSKPGQFGVPAGIAIGRDNQIYIADPYNHRIQVFEYVGPP